MPSVSLDRRELRVDGCPNDRMDEREGSVSTEDLDAAERRGGIGLRSSRSDPRAQRRDEIGLVAEDGHRVRQARRSSWEA